MRYGWTDGRTDGWTNGQTVRRTDGRTDGWTDRRTGQLTDRPTDQPTDRLRPAPPKQRTHAVFHLRVALPGKATLSDRRNTPILENIL